MLTLTLSSALGIVIRTLIIYFVVLLGLRLSGKREIGQMTVFDLVLLLLIANAVQNAMVGPDTSLTGGDGAVAGECWGCLCRLPYALHSRWRGQVL